MTSAANWWNQNLWHAANVNRSERLVWIDCDLQYFLDYCAWMNLSDRPHHSPPTHPRPSDRTFLDFILFFGTFWQNPMTTVHPRGSSPPLSENPRTAPNVVKVIALGLFPWICFTITYTAITSASGHFLWNSLFVNSISRPWFMEL